MFPLTVDHLLWRMSNVHPQSEVVSITEETGGTVTTRWAFPDVASRVRKLASGIHSSMGVGRGDVVAVLAFNTLEHFEALLAVPLLGAAVNSLNARLSPEVLIDQALSPRPDAVLVDAEMLDHPVLGDSARAVLGALREARVPLIVVGGQDWPGLAHAFVRYEDLVELGATTAAPAPVDDENTTAYLFHTSGTTGRPKSYRVSHRALVLHTLSQATTEASGLTRTDRVLPLAPFFHVNGWGLPLTCALTGASLLLCGGDLAAERIATVIRDEAVTTAAAVPTIWHDVCQAVATGRAPRPSALREVFSGGSAVPQSVVRSVEDVLGARVGTAWGMTETMACSTYERTDPTISAGVPIPLVEMRIDHDGFDHDRSGPVMGKLQVRGPFVVGVQDGSTNWFDTGDIASLDARGRLTLHDREKDLIKSGGEWIATAELEQYLCTHPAVTAAAVVPIAHPRWIERPLAYIVTLDDEVHPDIENLLRAYVGDRFPRWWIPDHIVVLDSLPRTAVGKVDKVRLRSQSSTDIQIQSEALA
ncbi:fatty-acid--CoA ligase [Rhodococcus opacus M213]|uniref:Fatty-acid--CoA ligase n=1 Tax=Rhodococcus opacus M213 TaxID=1129896 RepID=K8XKP9_RHOOP|nr:AMP-binding protein [Rhodococcus opacus]EKT77625.1 fatty-acid--CoA ligase [Rhodococcus opacus M213]